MTLQAKETENLFDCIYSILTNILSGRNATILIYKNTNINWVEVLIRYDLPIRECITSPNKKYISTRKYIFENINIVDNILRPVLNKLADNLAINIVEELNQNIIGKYTKYNENSLFDSNEIKYTDKENGIQFIITQTKPQRPQIIKTQFPVMISHQLLNTDQDILSNIPIKTVNSIIPTCIDIHTNIQINIYSQNTIDIVYAERYSADMLINTNTMENKVNIFDNGQIRLENKIDLRSNGTLLSQTVLDINTPDYSSIEETLNSHDIRVTRPIVVITDLINEVTKIAIKELKRYYNDIK